MLAKQDRAAHAPFDLAGLFSFDAGENPPLPLNPASGQPALN